MNKTRTSAALALLLLLPITRLAGQSAQTGERVVLTSFSGGIAKGAYQGGVDYVISEFLRRQRDEGFRRRLGITGSVRYRLGAATGASAGNINALLASISWCTVALRNPDSNVTAAFIPPEESLFWRVWVNTGFTHLLPKARPDNAEPAVLDRGFFETVHKENLRSLLQLATPGDCRVPLGITLTKLSPVKVALVDGRGTANVQRFATVLEVRTVDDGSGKRIDFTAPPQSVRSAGSLGALALLNDMELAGPGTRRSRLDTLFKAVLASSSFPVAFAPMEICYQHGGLKLAPSEPRRPCAKFNDGGLFDNNPFGLALRLYELTADSAGLSSRIEVVYSNPNRYRDPLEAARRDTTTRRDRAGLSAILQMLSGAWSAGTEYELQSLARLLERDRELNLAADAPGKTARATMLLSSRSAPIIGEQLHAFGGFLGRPFREYDFYTGVYDGLEFVARHFVCADDARGNDCASTTHKRLIAENAFDLGELALAVVRWQQAREHDSTALDSIRAADARRAAGSSDTVYAGRWTLLTAIDAAAPELLQRLTKQQCELRNDPVGSQLCQLGFRDFLQELSANDAAVRAAKDLAAWCASRPEDLRTGQCPADQAFVKLLEAPRWHLHELAERALENLQFAEDAIKESPRAAAEETDHQSALVEALFALYRTSSLRYRTGFAVNPSSARWDTSRPSRLAGSLLLGTALPNYVTLGGVGRSGEKPAGAAGDLSRVRGTSITAGWRPLALYFGESYYVTSVAELARFTDATRAPRERETSVAFGASLGKRAMLPRIKGLSSLELGLLSSRHVLSQESEEVTGRELTAILAARFAEKLYISAKMAPQRKTWALNFGLTDFNGLVYWWLR